jgi:hypothetical protein
MDHLSERSISLRGSILHKGQNIGLARIRINQKSVSNFIGDDVGIFFIVFFKIISTILFITYELIVVSHLGKSFNTTIINKLAVIIEILFLSK